MTAFWSSNHVLINFHNSFNSFLPTFGLYFIKNLSNSFINNLIFFSKIMMLFFLIYI